MTNPNDSQRLTVEGPDGVLFRPFAEAGCYFGATIEEKTGRHVLLGVAMLRDGSPDTEADGSLNVFEVTSMEDRHFEALLSALNQAFGTSFKPEDFPGR